MENQIADACGVDTYSADECSVDACDVGTCDVHTMTKEPQKSKIALPLIALGLDLIPVLVMFLGSLTYGLSSLAFFLIILSPIAGLTVGIMSLGRGKGQIGMVAKALSIIAIALPLAFVVFILVVYIGAVTGVISLM